MTKKSTSNKVIGNASGCEILFASTGCSLTIGEGCKLDDLQIQFHYPNQTVTIGDCCRLKGQIYMKGTGNALVIGARTRTNSTVWMNLSEPGAKVTIGDDCLFARVRFRPADSHSIIDIETGERLNPPGEIVVGDHVWLAEDVLLMKGAKIGAGSIVGAHSVVTGDIPDNSLAVGYPARVIRQGVRWRE